MVRGSGDALGPFATARGALQVRWLARAAGDDYEMQTQVRAGGTAPLGRCYFLTNMEMDKNNYRGAFFKVKLGPFLKNGAVADSSGLFGSAWPWDTGAQCKIRILGNVTVVLSYGRDWRGGHNVFYGTVLRCVWRCLTIMKPRRVAPRLSLRWRASRGGTARCKLQSVEISNKDIGGEYAES